MKKKESFALSVQFFLLTIVPLSLSSQSIQFSYDNNGNRTNREMIHFFKNSQEKQDISNQTETKIFDFVSDTRIMISPNPSTGKLFIILERTTETESSPIPIQLLIQSLSGEKILTITELKSSNEVDISNHPNGTYILSIVAGKERVSWKVIKS